jgi:hypothetical protein
MAIHHSISGLVFKWFTSQDDFMYKTVKVCLTIGKPDQKKNGKKHLKKRTYLFGIQMAFNIQTI